MFDVLAAYEQAGLPPVRGLDLDEEIQRAIESYNEHLRAGALRAKATRLFAESGDKEAAGSLLAESLRGFTAIGNPTEIAVTQRRIAVFMISPLGPLKRGLHRKAAHRRMNLKVRRASVERCSKTAG